MDDAQVKEMVRARYGGIAEAAGGASPPGSTREPSRRYLDRALVICRAPGRRATRRA